MDTVKKVYTTLQSKIVEERSMVLITQHGA